MPKKLKEGEDKSITKPFNFWQDREIRFDTVTSDLSLRENAEEAYATIPFVEDTKGNNGVSGTLMITNMRLVWWSSRYKTVNLTIGMYCIQNVVVQDSASKLAGGASQALHVAAKFGTSRFQFVFTCVESARTSATKLQANRARLFSSVQAVWQAYNSSRMYREIRVRSATVQDGRVVLFPDERMISKVDGATNISKEEGHLGTFAVTNVRVVWFANTADTLNVSIPYMQFIALRVQDSTLGRALVVETSTYAGNFILGFRVDPTERLEMLFQELKSLWKAWMGRPTLGMHVELNEIGTTAAAQRASEKMATTHGGGGGGGGITTEGHSHYPHEGGNILEEAPKDAFAAYYADEGLKGVDRKPVFEPSIGLAVEKLRKKVTLQDLWEVPV